MVAVRMRRLRYRRHSSDHLCRPLPCRTTCSYLRDNSLIGMIPTELGKLEALQTLYVPLVHGCSGGGGCADGGGAHA
jgi:hypothetical protein